MQKSTTTWSELKSQYYHNLMTLQTSIAVAHNSTVEMNRIYSEVIKKAKDSSPQIMKEFANSWLKKTGINDVGSFPALTEKYENLLAHPTEESFQDFGYAFLQKLHKEPFSCLDAYLISMQAFYDTWKEKWPN